MKLNVFGDLNLPIPASILYYNKKWYFADANELFVEAFGYSRSELEGMTSDDTLTETVVDHTDEDLGILLKSGGTVTREMRIKCADGSERWCKGSVCIYRKTDEDLFVLCTFAFIEGQKLAELEQHVLRNKYDLVLEITGELPFDYYVERQEMLVSHIMDEYQDNETKATRKDELVSLKESANQVHPMDRDEYLQFIMEASSRPLSGVMELRINVSGPEHPVQFKWFRLFYKSIADEDGNVVRIIGRCINIDEDKMNREEARRDFLTKFFTKGEIIKSIRKQFTMAPDLPYVLMLVDIDNFKAINDTFGHTFGDTVITDNANVIRSTLPEDVLLGRIGGDEFVILMINSSMRRAKKYAAELCENLSREYSGGGVVRHISASIGLAEYGRHGVTYEELFDLADRAMYRVKESGKNGYMSANQRDVKPIAMRVKETEERYSVNKNDQEFMMFAINLMTHARNIDGSLNMLLKRIASEYGLSHILLFENLQGKNFMTLSNYFSISMSFYEKSTFHQNREFHDEIEMNRFLHWNYSEMPEDNVICELFADNHKDLPPTLNLGVTKYEYIGGRYGFIYFVSEDPEFVWNERIGAMLLELTRMISIFVSLRFRMDESQAEIRHIQRRDQLTGLYHFEPFKSKAALHIQCAAAGSVFALEYMDINNFGYINENYGYKVGDQVLKLFAEDLKGLPCFVAGCRIYSDFFINLYVGEDEESLLEDVHSQHRRFANMQNYQYPSSGIGISSGIYIVDSDFLNIESAVENVSMAWKKAKSESKSDMFIFTPELKRQRVREQQILGEFYECLYRDDFKMYLQPKFKLGTHEIYGAEVLSRWQKPTGEVIAPGVFIEPLERIGYITELDFYMFESLLKFLTDCQKKGKPQLVYSTNFSGKHFENGGQDFLNRIRMISSKYAIDPKWIEIEITESVFITERPILRECIMELREMGFRIAIDDFGSGYSSLAILSEIPADVIKMDKSFLDVGMTEKRKSMLSEFARLVTVAEKETIFEGIETAEQEAFLMECGYVWGQGFLVEKPIEANEFEQRYL